MDKSSKRGRGRKIDINGGITGIQLKKMELKRRSNKSEEER